MSRSLDICVLCMDPPLPFGKAAARWYYVLLQGLERRGHRVRAFCAGSAADVEAAQRLFPNLRGFAVQARRSLVDKGRTLLRPLSHVFPDRLKQELHRELARGYDILHLEQVWSGWLAPPVRRSTLLHVHYAAARDFAFQRSASISERVMRWRTVAAERQLLRGFPFISTLTPELSEWARQVNPRASVFTIPFSLDPALYRFSPKRREPGAPLVVGLIGSFDWVPSYLAGRRLLERLWPAIRRVQPQARLLIAGRSAVKAFGELGAAAGCELVEDVPDIEPYFRRLDVMLYAPQGGSGMKVKTLEAFAWGVPVVCTPDGIEGIPAREGIDVEVAVSDQGLVSRTLSLLSQPGQACLQAVAARNLFERHCTPEPVIHQLEEVYARILASQTGVIRCPPPTPTTSSRSWP
jgi:polysaccharide biosynthesis protein PslH